MKIGILGGSFNPPHSGHIYISKLAIKKLGLNFVWWIPTKINPLKEAKIYEAYVSRIKKCQKLISASPKLQIKQFDEIYSEKLVQKLKKRFPHVEFFWIMGSDNLENLHRWKNFKKFISEIPLAIFSREKSLLKIQKTPAWNFVKKQNPHIFFTKNLDISSSEIRKTYKNT